MSCAPSRRLCAATAHEVPDGDGGWCAQGRLVDVAVRAALLIDADVRLIDTAVGSLAENIGGLCRYTAAR